MQSLFAHYKVEFLPFLLKLGTNSDILELGCGPSYLIKFLSDHGFQKITGIDISTEQIIKAKSKGYNVIKMEVMEYLRTIDTQYDVIFALDLIEHFTKDELIVLVKLINTRLKDNGILIIRTPNGDGLFPNKIIYGDLTHQTILNQNSLSQLLNFAGFTHLVFMENAPIAKNLKGLLRSFLWKIIKISLNFVKIVETGGGQNLWTQDLIC